jgi:hypothetical protein
MCTVFWDINRIIKKPTRSKRKAETCLQPTSYSLLGLLLDLEDGRGKFLRNFGGLLPDVPEGNILHTFSYLQDKKVKASK